MYKPQCVAFTNDRPQSTILRRHVVSASARGGLAGLGGLINPTSGIIEE